MHVLFLLSVISITALASGCASLQPTSKEGTVGGAGWQSYAEARKAYDAIEVGKTSISDLRKMDIIVGRDAGRDITSPNIYAYSQTKMVDRFLRTAGSSANGDLVKLPDEINRCLDYAENCEAYDVFVRGTVREGEGSVLLRAIGYKSENRTFTWHATIFLVIHHGIVVYKEIDGTPTGIVTRDEKRTPLGPLQHWGKVSSD